jgi:hypothetical protein
VAISAARITAGATTVALAAAEGGGSQLIVRNTEATNAASLGAADVASGTGFLLAAGQTVTINLDAGDVLYAVQAVAAASAVLAVLRT